MPQPRAELAESFRFDGVARAYAHRPPYPAEAIDLLVDLVVGTPRTVVDLGAGEGSLARPLSERVDRVYAVEPSPAMVVVGRTPGEDVRGSLTWIEKAAEDLGPADVAGPVGLAVAGAAMHWFDLPVVCGRLSTLLAPGAMLAVCGRHASMPGMEALTPVIQRFSRSPEHDPDYDVTDDLERRGLWRRVGRHRTAPIVFEQSIEEHIEHLHSTASLARELMTPGDQVAFAAAVRDVLAPLADDRGVLHLTTVATLTWGHVNR